jgi:hypothetical protein
LNRVLLPGDYIAQFADHVSLFANHVSLFVDYIAHLASLFVDRFQDLL